MENLRKSNARNIDKTWKPLFYRKDFLEEHQELELESFMIKEHKL